MYVKKPLSQRLHLFGDGRTEPVQRDLYSAFLARCCERDTLEIRRVHETWPDAEPLLRRAMSRGPQRASGEGLARPNVLTRVRAARPSKRDGRICEAADAVAQARTVESVGTGTLRTPRL